MNLTFRLIVTLGCGGLAFGLAGAAVSAFLPIPHQTILLDRSYCPPEQWQGVVQDYSRLYSQHQRKVVVIAEVITFSNLGSQPLAEIPSPSEVEQMSTFGRSAEVQQEQLLQSHDDDSTVLLGCQ